MGVEVEEARRRQALPGAVLQQGNHGLVLPVEVRPAGGRVQDLLRHVGRLGEPLERRVRAAGVRQRVVQAVAEKPARRLKHLLRRERAG